MTDKELRKLSRLELLELLLEASKENSKLKEEIEKFENDNKPAQNIENLSEATRQIENALKYANSLTDILKAAPKENNPVYNRYESCIKSKEPRVKPDPLSDREIYRRMLSFFAKNDDKLGVFPADIENDVRNRINSILKKRNRD